ncbi:MAG: signal peptidase II [Chitinophagales bacterium]|nr:signal peptidase II [Chitinophagales bacterium]
MESKKLFRNVLIVFIIALNIGCDQISKNVVREQVDYHEQINILDKYIILTKVENAGAFLGLGDSIPRPLYKILMIFLPILVIGYTLFYIAKETNMTKSMLFGLSLIIGGGIGNIIDRIIYGSVTDFLYFDFVVFHTGIVNMADISVTVGFFLILFGMYFKKPEQNISIENA